MFSVDAPIVLLLRVAVREREPVMVDIKNVELCIKFGHDWITDEEGMVTAYCDVCGVHKWWYHALSEEE